MDGEVALERVYSDVLVVDGTGSEPYRGDVGVVDDKIVAIAEPGSLSGSVVVPGHGRALGPGFVDIHSHADYPLLVDGRAHSAVTQGVTTLVPGNCGHGVAPFLPSGKARMSDIASGVSSARPPEAFGEIHRFDVYLDVLRSRGVGVNVLPLVAHGLLRASVAGFEMREVSRDELSMMQAMTRDAMDAGAIGMSSGLEYAPGIAATKDELAAIASVVGEFNGLYATHCRNRSDRIVEAAQEGVFIAESGGCRLEMSHFVRRPTGPSRGLAERANKVVRDANDRGVRARFDVFPFDYGPSPIMMFVPQKFREEAGSEFAARLRERNFVRRILDGLDERFVQMLEKGHAARMYVSNDGQDGRYVGKSMGEIAEQMGMSVAEAAIELLVEADEDFRGVYVNEPWADDEDLVAAFEAPDYLIMGDGSIANLDGPLECRGFALSDWGYATAALGVFVRERGVLTLQDAVRRMTSAPAEQIGMASRGRIKEGLFADLVLFDPESVGSGVTPDNLCVLSTGIDEVMVNGVPVVERGQVTNAVPGRVGRHDVM